MSDTTGLVAGAARRLSSEQIERASKFAREPIVLDGERPDDLVPGSARRRAVDAALAELDAGLETPSIEWRRDYSLVLGLERLLESERPTLLDGAELSEHQVDALSGTLAALVSELEEPRSNGRGNGVAAVRGANGEGDVAEETNGVNGAAEADDTLAPDEEEPRDWEEPELVDELAEAPEDPGASRRFWFEHATGAGKTVAAVGFVEASRTGGILILTHRRNLVDQFIGEISDRGYADRLSPPLLDGADHPYGPVTVETYQWFVRNSTRISDA
jgi:ribonuclease E